MRVLTATLLVILLSAVTSSLPTSLVADAQDAATKGKLGVKRAEEEMLFGNQQNKPSASGIFYSPVSKRAVQNEEVLPTVFQSTEPPMNEPEDNDGRRLNTHALSNEELIAHMRRGALDKDENSKTIKQYEKGYLYGVGKEALDKKAENALLKSEVYGDPVNEYRYYGGGDPHRQERVAPKMKKSMLSVAEVGARLKRDLELDPESLLALISLWQSEHKSNYPSYRERVEYPRYGYERQDDNDEGDEEEDMDNVEYPNVAGEWLDNPVPLSRYQYEVGGQYPMVSQYGSVENYPRMRNMYYPPLTRVEHKRGQWGAFAGSGPEKRFMVSKRRQWEEPNLWSRVLASQPRDPLPGMIPRRRILM